MLQAGHGSSAEGSTGRQVVYESPESLDDQKSHYRSSYKSFQSIKIVLQDALCHYLRHFGCSAFYLRLLGVHWWSSQAHRHQVSQSTSVHQEGHHLRCWLGQGLLNPTASSKQGSLTISKYDRGKGACNNQVEGGEKDAVFVLEDGATLRNVIIGKHQSEGVYCKGYVFSTSKFRLKNHANSSRST